MAIDFLLVLENLDHSSPVLFLDDVGQLTGFFVRVGEDKQRVGIPEIVGQVPEFDQSGRQEMGRLRIVRKARTVQERCQPQAAMAQ